MAITRLRIRVGGNWYNVEVGDLDRSPVQVTVDGETFAVEVEGLAGQTPPVPVVAARRRRASWCPRLPAGSIPPAATATSSALPCRAVSSPSWYARATSVSVGQEVCVVEAMKMEQSIRSPQNGVVKEIRVQPMDSVRTNDPLMELE